MAVTQTGAVFKALSFDGTSSRTYGVYITGSAVYNAPARDVEMISIPGRNGAFALDKGRFENIEVSYPAGIYADSEADFAQAISDFRNFLCSKEGYCRLEDEYNPQEYRMAVYKSGLEVTPAQLRAGEFTITFECKPQRWLTAGETPVTIASSGDTITNPTLFEASPLLEVEGYGTIEFNGYEIELEDELVGDVQVSSSFSKTTSWEVEILPYMNIGDEITVSGAEGTLRYYDRYDTPITSASKDYDQGDGTASVGGGGRSVTVSFTFNDPLTFYYGTDEAKYVFVRFVVVSHNVNYYFSATMAVLLQGKILKFYYSSRPSGVITCELSSETVKCNSIRVNSTATTYGHPTYIDCDLGEAYADDNGVISSLNSYIDLGSKLPTLAVGSTEVTFDNTITDLKITPRWWKV